MTRKKYYITTPLYYVNDVPHLGHAYTTIAADVLARYRRMRGDEVFFLTGTDEHGQKIWNAAEKAGRAPQPFVDQMAEGFKEVWKVLNISYDDFIRTSEPRHIEIVQRVFSKLLQQGDIYKGEYVGWYCVPCESFWAEIDLKEDIEGRKLCPDCGRATDLLKEESYFFRLSKYQEGLLKYIDANPGYIRPESRKNEALQFIRQGLKDLSVTRTAFPWGVAVREDPRHVVYVWFDALINYISALGYLEDGKRFEKLWPADLHLMGKEIVRFHAVIWPCMLMALGVPLPQKIFGHGWWTVEGEKMSKSKGNVVDPLALSHEYGVDSIRYFLLREVPFGLDGDFSRTSFINRYNADLANDLGNLLSRTLTMAEKYFNGIIPDIQNIRCDKLSEEIVDLYSETPDLMDEHLEKLAFSEALCSIWKLISCANSYIEKEAPWKIAKAGEKEKLAAIIFNLCQTIKVCACMLSPFIPSTSEKIWKQLNLQLPIAIDANIAGVKVSKETHLFPRIVS